MWLVAIVLNHTERKTFLSGQKVSLSSAHLDRASLLLCLRKHHRVEVKNVENASSSISKLERVSCLYKGSNLENLSTLSVSEQGFGFWLPDRTFREAPVNTS